MVTPVTEWTVIEREDTPPAGVLVGYVLPLALLGAVATIIGERLALASLEYQIGVSVTSTVVRALGGVVLTLAGCAIRAFLLDALAPSFGGTKDLPEAFKLAGYAFTPALVAQLARVIPFAGALLGIVGIIYSIYLFYLGITPLMKCPRERAAPYTAVVIGIAILAMWIMAMMLALLV